MFILHFIILVIWMLLSTNWRKFCISFAIRFSTFNSLPTASGYRRLKLYRVFSAVALSQVWISSVNLLILIGDQTKSHRFWLRFPSSSSEENDYPNDWAMRLKPDEMATWLLESLIRDALKEVVLNDSGWLTLESFVLLLALLALVFWIYL